MSKPATVAALAVITTGAVAAPVFAASARDESIARTIRTRNVPVTGVPGVRSSATARLSFPATWRLARRTAATLTLREGNASCQYTVRATIGVAAGDETDASAHAAAALPATGPLLLESGIRNSAAWRVIRRPESGSKHLEAIGVVPLVFASQQAGRKLWVETRISGRSDRGDECHSGTYRATLGPALGDALATQRARAFVTKS